MLRSLKKMLILIPCMIFGMFFVNSISVDAVNTELIGAKSITFGAENNGENKYFFTNSRSWEFKTEYNVLIDTYLTYRIIKPTGEATKESKKINYVNSGGAFNIGDYTELEFTETEDMSTRVSVAPASTYYIDIKYYGSYLEGLLTWDQDKDETIKLVVCEDSTISIPSVSVEYDSVANKFTLNASVLKDGKGYSIIDKIEYYYSSTEIENEVSNFRANMENSADSDEVGFEKAPEVSVQFMGPGDSANTYLYVMVTTANNYSMIVSYDISNADDEPAGGGNNQTTGTNNNSDSTGLFDYGLGELILLVLVVVLIVSCVLIITQKIVDHKKRLY